MVLVTQTVQCSSRRSCLRLQSIQHRSKVQGPTSRPPDDKRLEAMKKLAIHSDSQLITNQTTREYVAKHPRMAQYLEKVRKQLEAFQTYTLTQVPRADNAHANALASLSSAFDHQLKRSIPVEYLDKPSIETEPAVEVSQVSTTPNWRNSTIRLPGQWHIPHGKIRV